MTEPTDIAPKPPSYEEIHLGDGVYTHFDGYYIWLTTPNQGSYNQKHRALREEIQARPPTPNEIELFFHCRRCLEEKPQGIAPKDFAKIGVGYTKKGIQVWCERHNINIMHMDLEGCRHPATMLP